MVIDIEVGRITTADHMIEVLQRRNIELGSCAEELLHRVEYINKRETILMDSFMPREFQISDQEWETAFVFERFRGKGRGLVPPEAAALTWIQQPQFVTLGMYKVFAHEPIIDEEGVPRLFSITCLDLDFGRMLGTIPIDGRKWRDAQKFMCRV